MASKTFVKEADPLDAEAGEDLATQVAALQEQVQALLKMQMSGGGLSEERLEKILNKVAQTQADAAERAANPSNKTHPGISVYSYPEGDRAKPRHFKCPMTWAGHPLDIDTTSAEEIDLFNLAEPGVYQFLRTDHSRDTLTVDGDRNAGGTLEKLHFRFMVTDRRDTLPGIAAMLRSAFHVKTAQEHELETLRAQVEAMRTGQGVPA